MDRIEADIEALAAMRQALSLFAVRQTEAMASMAREISNALYELDESAHYWQREGEHHAEAPQRLAHVQHLQQRLQEAYDWHQQQAERLGVLLNEETVPDGVRFLGARIEALQAYYGVTAEASQPQVVPTGRPRQPQSCDAALRQSIQASETQIRERLGTVGDEIIAQVLSDKFAGTRVDLQPLPDGVDHICAFPGLPVMVVVFADDSGAATQTNEQVVATAVLTEIMVQAVNTTVTEPQVILQPVMAVAAQMNQMRLAVYVRPADGTWQRLDEATDLSVRRGQEPHS